jgi:hypothetical protein
MVELNTTHTQASPSLVEPMNSLDASRRVHRQISERFSAPQDLNTIIEKANSHTFNFQPLRLNKVILTTLKTALIILFPLLLLVCVIAAFAYCIIQKANYDTLIAKFLGLPALRLNKKNLDLLRNHVLEDTDHQQTNGIKTSEINLRLQDSVELNGIKIEPNEKTDKWLIYFNGNNGCYEANYNSMVEFSKQLDVNVLCFNYRGVGKSGGICLKGEQLTSDAVEVIKYAHQTLGAAYENITVYGFSLGGATAGTALTEANFPKTLRKMKFINDRSFSKAKLASMSLIRIPLYSHFLRWITKSNWNLKPFKNAASLQNRLCIIASPQDAVIPIGIASYYKKANKHADTVFLLDFDKHVETKKSLWARFKAHGEAHYYDLNKEILDRIRDWIRKP